MHPVQSSRSLLNLSLFTAAVLAGCSAVAQAPTPPDSPAPKLVAGTQIAHRDKTFDVPTFVFIESSAPPAPGSQVADVAWRTLRQLAPLYRLTDAALDATTLRGVHDTGRGAIIAHFAQRLRDYDVFRLEISIALNRSLQPVAASGYLAPRLNGAGAAFALDEASAIAAATTAMQAIVKPRGGGVHPQAIGTPPVTTSRLRRTYYPRPDGLVPAYYVELDAQEGQTANSEMYAFVVSALDGSILFQKDLTAADSYVYRVWADKDKTFSPWDGPQGTAFSPHPTGKRDGTALSFVPSQLVTLQNAPFSKNDPWLPPAATEARGNNAIAYADLFAPDGFDVSKGDLMLTTSAPGTFDYSLNVETEDPAGNSRTIHAVTTNFFYIVNYMHDYFYDAGWDEASRNPQKDNYGRGGVGGDPIRAEAQDYTGRNNANASTPADGKSPRIQMYLWDPSRRLHINQPADLAADRDAGSAAFGPKIFDLTRDVVLVDDGVDTAGDGCETPFVNAAALAGKIAVIDRGKCSFDAKTLNAQQNGAAGVIVVNNIPGSPASMGSSTPPPATPITIPALMLSLEDGIQIKSRIGSGTTVNFTMQSTMVNNDSSLDGTIVAHEWGHILSNRLIGNASGLDNTQGAGMGEGWSDFVALLTITRAEDIEVPSNANWTGVYPVSSYSAGPANNASYDGIRRYPYSADMTKAPLTLKHIQNGVALPTMPSPSYGQDGADNAEVHAVGEVWANMLFDCYVALLRDTARYDFAQANKVMRDYLVASLKLTPSSPTILEARDAVLAAAYANSAEDYQLFVKAFARRGAGIGAVGPDRSSDDNVGVVESTATGADFTVEAFQLDDSVTSCDHDGILDNEEVGRLTIKLRNTGSIPLSATATVSASNPSVGDGSSKELIFPTVPPYTSTSATMDVPIKDLMFNQAFDLRATISAQNQAVPGDVSVTRSFRSNYDVAYGTSANDTMDDANAVWNISFDSKLDTANPFHHNDEKGYWSIVDTGATSDHYLTSPPLKVSSSGKFGFTLRHRYSFEADIEQGANYDGAVIEISSDGGKTWQDTGAQLVQNGYNGTLWNKNPPLADRSAFTAQSPNYPEFRDTVADFGSAYKGQTVNLRFRVGTDPGTGGPGWDLDEIRITGIDNTPFSSHVVSHKACRNRPPMITLTSQMEQTVQSGATVTLGASATDLDGDALTYRWTQQSGPMVMLNDYQSTAPTFTAPAVQESVVLRFAVVANDGTVDSAAAIAQIHVVPKGGQGDPPPTSSGCAMSPGKLGQSAAGSAPFATACILLFAVAALRRRRRSASAAVNLVR